MKKISIILLLIICYTAVGLAQKGVVETLYSSDSTITFRIYDTQIIKIDASSSREMLKELLQTRTDDDLALTQAITDDLGYIHYFYQQYYKGIKVENGSYISHTKNGLVKSVNGDFFNVSNVDIQATITESEALQMAIETIGAIKYKWQVEEEEKFIKRLKEDSAATYYPKGETVIVYSDSVKSYRLAYKFNIYAQYPLSRNNVFVDAITGKVLKIQNLIFDTNATGTADTRYSGTQTITTDSYTGGYRLRELTNSIRIETYNMRNHGTSYSSATDFSDNDNSWTAAEYNNAYYDNAALDAHWGTERVYAYWNNIRGVNSWNGSGAPLLSYVHTDLTAFGYLDNDNAFWDGEKITYGDGTTTFYPLTSLDVVAHEIGHGFRNGVKVIRGYSYEILSSGLEAYALNEGMSDIWAACVEQWAAPTKNHWQVGEEIMRNGFSCLRSLRDPNTEGYRNGYSTEGNYPDTYEGTYWYSGTNSSTFSHTNATVLSHWFYLLTEGESGTNDFENAYHIMGIGIAEAAAIAWRAELYYFSSNTDFPLARTATILAADDICGENSFQSIQVENAWYAIGVGNDPGQISLSGPTILCASNTTYSINNPPSGATVSWSCSSNISYISGQGTTSCVFRAYTNGSGWIKVTFTTPTGSFDITKTVSVGLRATFSGSTTVLLNGTGTWTAYPTCGNEPYTYRWFLRKEGTGMAATMVGDESTLTLWSLPVLKSVPLGTTMEDSDDSLSENPTKQPSTRTYFRLYLRVYDDNNAMYETAEKRITAYGDVDLISRYLKSGENVEDITDITARDALNYEQETDYDAPVLVMSLAPNPAGEWVDITVDGLEEYGEGYRVEFVNSMSRVVKALRIDGSYNRISIGDLANGYYVVRIISGKDVISKILLVDN